MKNYYNKPLIVIVLIFGVFSFLYFSNNSSGAIGFKGEKELDLYNLASSSLPVSPDIAEKVAVSALPPEGYIKYQNNKYSFYLYHSPQAKITEYDEGEGAMTITLENEKKVRGMQIFIVPYWDKTISEERFKLDVKSGVRTNIEKSSVDGVEAVTFNSVSRALGSTREVWFIRGGYLYEVTTFQGVGDWFVPIMQTWRFI